MSNPRDGSQSIGESSVNFTRGEEAYEGSDDDDPVAKHAAEETMLDAHPQGDLGDGLETP
jgi:hypothetical protein